MLSLQRLLLSNNDKFFDLLEASAAEASLCAHELTDLLDAPPERRTPDGLIAIRRRNKLVHEETVALLCASFVTPLEREDIEAVSRRLYRIPKMIEKFSERLLLAQTHISDETFQRQIELLKQATGTVQRMVAQLRHRIDLERIGAENSQLQQYERAADKLMLELLADLYRDGNTALQMIITRDLFELLERAIDRCRDVGNVILQIALKNQ